MEPEERHNILLRLFPHLFNQSENIEVHMIKNLVVVSSFLLFSFPLIAQVDYSSEIQPIFSNNCSACHGVGQNGFNSGSYAGVMASTSPASRYNRNHVIPNDADGSPLVDKIEPNPQFGTRMPTGGALSTDEITKIKNWINEGALEEVATTTEAELFQPEDFKLLGNYPNPFNPTTTIRFQLPVSSNFQISIYNANGQLVKTINGNAMPGINQQSVDLTNQASGVYIYRVRVFVNDISNMIGFGKLTLVK